MNDNVNIEKEEILSNDWSVLKKITFKYRSKNGRWDTRDRETYDRGNGAVILLYNKERKTIILTNQFRLATYVNGNTTGMLVEACAGLLDQDSPEEAIRRETEEETGFILSSVEKIFEAYMSPGSVTEKLYFFIAEYTTDMQKHGGGGVDGEDIEVMELQFDDAMAMIANGEMQDGKTIMLLQHLALSKIMG